MRLVVIGDLHGCLDELRALLAVLSPGHDDLVTCVGDFVTKGPRPLECVELWREKGWPAVLGNNDRDVLRIIRGEAPDVKEDLVNDALRLEKRVDLVEYLESLPMLIDMRDLDTSIVHGGLLPDDGLNTSMDVALTLRDVVREGDKWRRARGSDPRDERRFWADVWHGPRFAIYGHTPREEVAVHPRAMGIDTGCVYGWRLTAAVRSEDGQWTTRSVPAKETWAQR